MPSAMLTSDSLVFTQQGWQYVSQVASGDCVLGADRHGHLTFEGITITHTQEHERTAFLCTDAYFGKFSANTILLLHDGSMVTADDAVSEYDSSGFLFEQADPPQISWSAESEILVFAALKRCSAYASEFVIVRRCIDSNVHLGRPLRGVDVVRACNQPFCLIDVKNCRVTIPIIKTLCECILGVVEEPGTLVFDVYDGLLAMWYLYAIRLDQCSYVLTYDSLQHSVAAVLRMSEARHSPFKSLRSSFYAGLAHGLRITWAKPRWKIIVNGFLVAGS